MCTFLTSCTLSLYPPPFARCFSSRFASRLFLLCASHPPSTLPPLTTPTSPMSLPTRPNGQSAQLAALSQRSSVEPMYGDRDRGQRGRCERGPGRVRSSWSRSPPPRSPTNRFRKPHPASEMFAPSVCPICLGRKQHNIRVCRLTSLWDGKHKTQCARSEDGRIIDNNGQALCYNWNQATGCKDKSGHHIYECSGCGDLMHGAQECSRAQKAPPSC